MKINLEINEYDTATQKGKHLLTFYDNHIVHVKLSTISLVIFRK